MSSGSYGYDDEYPEGDHEIERQWQQGNWQEFVPQSQQQPQPQQLPREFVPRHLLQQQQQEFVSRQQEYVPHHQVQEFVPQQEYHPSNYSQSSFASGGQHLAYSPAMAAAALNDNTFDPAMAAAALNDNTFYPQQHDDYDDDDEYYDERQQYEPQQQHQQYGQQAMYYGEYGGGGGAYGNRMISESNWMEIARLPDDASRFNSPNSGVTAVAFDAEEELVWIGRGDGRMMALSTDGLEPYCSFDGHTDVVRSICGVQNGVVSCSRRSLVASSRGGVFKGEISLATSKIPEDYFRCCTAIDANSVVAAGTFKHVANVDVGISPATFSGALQKKSVFAMPCGTGAIAATGPAPGASSSGFVNSQQVCYVGGVDGRLRLVDFRAKRGIVSEFDVSPGKACVVSLATSGASVSCVSLFGNTVHDLRILDDSVEVAAGGGRPQKAPAFELAIKIVDVRSKTRPIHSLTIPALEGTPSLVSLLKPPFVESSLAGTLAVARSRSHVVAVCDAGGDGSDARRLVSSAQKPVFFSGQNASAATLSMAASALSGQLLAIGDANGTLVLWGSRPDARATAANPDEARPSIERPSPDSRFPKPPIDLDARAKRWPPNNGTSPANAYLPAPENPVAALNVPLGADAPPEDIIPKMNLLSDEVRHVIEGEVMARWTVDDSVPLQQQKHPEGGDRRKGESAAKVARRALELEPKGADRYTNRVVKPEINASDNVRRDGPLVGVPTPGDFKPNSLLHDPKAEEACYAMVDPRVASRGGDEKAGDEIPRKYARCLLDVSRRGVDGFDFSQFNDTPFGGLENSLQETSFTNAPLLMLYFVPEIRKAILAEQYRGDSDKAGLILELSLLFDAFDAAPRLDKNRRACHSESVISALCQSPDAVALGLVTDFDRSSNQKQKAETRKQLASKASIFLRFVLDQIDINLSQRQGLSTDLFGLETVTTNEFIQAGNDAGSHSSSSTSAKKGSAGASRKVKTLTTEIQLEPPFLFRNQQKSNALRLVEGVASRAETRRKDGPPAWRFADALQSSLVRSTRARAWRDSSRCYEPISQNRSPRPPLPNLLSLKCDIDSAEKAKGGGGGLVGANWFPLEFQARVDSRGKCQVFEKVKSPNDDKHEDKETEWIGAGDAIVEERGSDFATYDLIAVVSRVIRPGNEEGLVVHCSVGPEYYERAADDGDDEKTPESERDKDRWILINDFLVEEVEAQDAIAFVRGTFYSCQIRIDLSSRRNPGGCRARSCTGVDRSGNRLHRRDQIRRRRDECRAASSTLLRCLRRRQGLPPTGSKSRNITTIDFQATATLWPSTRSLYSRRPGHSRTIATVRASRPLSKDKL